MSMTFEVDVTRAIALVAGAETAVSDSSIRAWMVSILDAWMQEETVNRFAYEGDHRSGAWAPLSETTENIREWLGFPPDEINVREGELFNYAISSRVGFAAMGAEYETPDTEGILAGDLAAKFVRAQEGGDNPNPRFGHTPARPVVAFDPASDTEMVLSLLAADIHAKISAGGFL